jgi:hypothetical protein
MVKKELNTRKFAYILCAAAVIGWVAFRFTAIGSEKARYVFNAARIAADQGAPVEVLTVVRKKAALKEPLAVHDNRAYVSGARVGKFAAGQKVGDGVIVSVSRNVDLDSGMHVIRTRGVKDGLNYAESESVGYFVPIQAVHDNAVMVAADGVAQRRSVQIADRDSEIAVISQGLSDGDEIILSKISENNKVRFQK